MSPVSAVEPASGACALCGATRPSELLAKARAWRFWTRPDGACPACVQDALLQTLLDSGDAAMHHAVQTVWPIDAEAAFGALPTPLRLHADPRYRGRCTTIAFVDSGFHPHPDLTQPQNRIRAWVDAGSDAVDVRVFAPDVLPRWPGWDAGDGSQWHGTMTSVAAAGNGFLSHGLYRGLASEADVVLVRALQPDGRITNASIERALRWILEHGRDLGVRIVNLSVGGEPAGPGDDNPVDRLIGELVAGGVVVTAAAGNDGVRRLVPPASSPGAITVGGLDDANSFTHEERSLWHSNWGEAQDGGSKPELVAPSIWLAAPVLPGTSVAMEATSLFEYRIAGNHSVDPRIDALKLITPHYQHVDGTSFAAPLVASVVACMIEANRALSPSSVRDLLIRSATRVPGADAERQGAGAVEAGLAVAWAAHESHATAVVSPVHNDDGVTFVLHDHQALRVRVAGSWDDWSSIVEAVPDGGGLWTSPPIRVSAGDHVYKYVIDDDRWIDDPANRHKVPDGFGGFNSALRTV